MADVPTTRLRIGSLCSGYGGLDLGIQAALGGTVVWHAENNPDAARILARHWPGVPNLGDLTTTDWAQVPRVCVLAAGFPCQDLSVAGRRAGLAHGTRSGLWRHIAHAVSVLQPCLVVIENVRGILSAPAHSDVEPCPWCLGDTPAQPAVRALGAVLADLADLRFDARWLMLRARDVGAPHRRERIFLTAWPAHTQGQGLEGPRPQPSRSGPERGGAAAEDAHREPGHHRRRPAPTDPEGRGPRTEPGRRGGTPPAHPESVRRDQGLTEPAVRQRGPDPALGSGPPAPAPEHGRYGRRGHPALVTASSGPTAPAGRADDQPGDADPTAWGPYAAAIARWETRTRPAPPPTNAAGRLSPAFVEWMQGLPDGWVTATPGLSRSAQLTALGNGVVPQQAAAAIRLLAPPACDHRRAT